MRESIERDTVQMQHAHARPAVVQEPKELTLEEEMALIPEQKQKQQFMQTK